MPSSNIWELIKTRNGLIGLLALVIIAGAIYWLGQRSGSVKGYMQAQTEVINVKESNVSRVVEQKAKSENPFQTVNPLSKVEANPFEKTKKIMNPFEN